MTRNRSNICRVYSFVAASARFQLFQSLTARSSMCRSSFEILVIRLLRCHINIGSHDCHIQCILISIARRTTCHQHLAGLAANTFGMNKKKKMTRESEIILLHRKCAIRPAVFQQTTLSHSVTEPHKKSALVFPQSKNSFHRLCQRIDECKSAAIQFELTPHVQHRIHISGMSPAP